jgi:hypothetical protein
VLSVVGAVSCFPPLAQADTPTFVLGTVSTNPPSSFTGTRGWQFWPGSLPNGTFITQLGVFDSGGDGLVNPHQIGLWREQGDVGILLASATVPAGTAAPLVGGYRWVPIAPVLIPVGFSALYDVAAQYSAGDADDLVSPQPDYTTFTRVISPQLNGGKLAFGTDLPYPVGFAQPPCEGCIGERFWEPNFQYTVVPEPSLLLLVAAASFCFLVRYRRALVSRERRT